MNLLSLLLRSRLSELTTEGTYIQHICIATNCLSLVHKCFCCKSYKLMSLTSFLSCLWKLSFTEAHIQHALGMHHWYPSSITVVSKHVSTFIPHVLRYLLITQSFFIISSTFFERSAGGSCAFSLLAVNLVTYILANRFRCPATQTTAKPNSTDNWINL